jgi:hypothetical protein
MIASVNFAVHVNPSQMNVDTCALALPGLKMRPGGRRGMPPGSAVAFAGAGAQGVQRGGLAGEGR